MDSQNLKTNRVKHAIGAITLFVFLGTSATWALTTENDKCHNSSGKGEWTLIPSPNDPLGRILGPTSGGLKGAVSAFLTSLTPNPDGSLHVTSSDSWVLGPQDTLQFSGDATWTPIPDQPIGTVAYSLTLTALGGTGAYAGATGTINVTGTGFNVFGPGAGPGNTYFDVRFRGSICTPD